MNLSTHDQTQPRVLRQVAFTVPAFDYLKAFQREYSATHGVWLDNSKALAAILKDHQQTTATRTAGGSSLDVLQAEVERYLETVGDAIRSRCNG